MDANAKCEFRCALVVPPAGGAWLAQWIGESRHDEGLGPPVLLDGAGEVLAHALACHPGAPFDTVLLPVCEQSLTWARRWAGTLAGGGTPVVAITRALRAGAVRSLLQLGVADFVASEGGREELKLRLWRLRQLAPARPGPGSGGAQRHPLLSSLIGSSPAFVAQVERIPVIASCDATVLILGETGNGKELCARAIHALGARAAQPWVAVNCGALPPELIETELFGHTRGAFTSSHEARAGLIGEAERGTLFLDEIDSLPLAAQVKLLRFLQEKEYRPVGGAGPRHADVRVIAATNTEPEAMIEQGRLRRDLYYRLNILSLQLPPLRERLEDLLPLIDHFVRRYAAQFGRPVCGLTRPALARLASHRWPGNVRELEHAIERAVLFSRGGLIDAADLGLPETVGAASACASFREAKGRTVDAFERSYVERLLLMCEGNITHAAEAAGKNRRAFWQLIRKHGIDAGRYRLSERA